MVLRVTSCKADERGPSHGVLSASSVLKHRSSKILSRKVLNFHGEDFTNLTWEKMCREQLITIISEIIQNRIRNTPGTRGLVQDPQPNVGRKKQKNTRK